MSNSDYNETNSNNNSSSESEQGFPGDGTNDLYRPSPVTLDKFNELYSELKYLSIGSYRNLLNPKTFTYDELNANLKEVNTILDQTMNASVKTIEKKQQEVTQELAKLKDRVNNDENHLKTLKDAKKDTDFSDKINDSKKELRDSLDTLRRKFMGLLKTSNSKESVEETYTKVLLYIQNKPLEEKDVCRKCTEISNAYGYIQKQFSKEKKWMEILDDQMNASKVGAEIEHEKLVLGDPIYADVVEKAEKLHHLYFAFRDILEFNTDKSVKYEGEVIDLDIRGTQNQRVNEV